MKSVIFPIKSATHQPAFTNFFVITGPVVALGLVRVV